MRRIGKHILYYGSMPLCYLGIFWLVSRLVSWTGNGGNLGAAMAATYGLLFLATPALLFLGMLINRANRAGDLHTGWEKLIGSLAQDSGEGFWYLGGLFLFGLLCTLSLRRARGDHLPGRILERLRKK